MDITYRCSFVLVIAVMAFATGCATSSSQKAPPPAVLSPNGTDAEIAERILQLVPVDTPMDSAKQMLIDAGLRCNAISDSETGETYLSCGYSDERDTWVTWVWSIRVQCADGVVSGVTCRQAGIGP